MHVVNLIARENTATRFQIVPNENSLEKDRASSASVAELRRESPARLRGGARVTKGSPLPTTVECERVRARLSSDAGPCYNCVLHSRESLVPECAAGNHHPVCYCQRHLYAVQRDHSVTDTDRMLQLTRRARCTFAFRRLVSCKGTFSDWISCN